ncbi:MAG: DUF3048 domain-containing protein [Atribacterota bacterium]|nr:DUF3048 domain-containing protein [Atribacterota bacterium]MDD3640335.1 DUF3048 domain-containing protein [Atribacterota bacterium]MDD4288156.1 DUF3048 domain-containing protein [Atribacterota bacterium]MDD4764587.1 DUF3048 domain-containing protein [Atribacterota bacterium]MDI9596003.1 DUF3048 domain-containing protein [Atribacterota bacterium]
MKNTIGYRAKRRKVKQKSFLGRSFLISVIINILFIFAFSNLITFDIFDLPPEEEIIEVTMMELPAARTPVSPRPEIIREEPLAEMDVKPKVDPMMPEPAQIQEVETLHEIEEQVEIEESTPKVEVKVPEIEIPAEEDIAPIKEEIALRQDVQMAAREIDPSLTSRREIEGQMLEEGSYEMQANLGTEGRERIESTYGSVVTPGRITSLPDAIEKESPFGNRPLAVMIDNASFARPQSGLDKADIVYEVLAEGGITRFLAIYATKEADKVGPVRSARPYFITKTLEHNAIYVHAGESPDAARFIREERIDDINELVHFQPFWRSQDRNAPHNLYASTEQLRDETRRLGYIEMVNKGDYQFEIDREEVLTGRDAQKIDIRYHNDYIVSYQYISDGQRYVRYINGQLHIDAETGRPIDVKNIIIQHSEKKVIDEEGRLSIDFIGEGSGLIIFNGKSEEITWKKESLQSKTLFYNKEGNRLAIQPGNVWIQVIHPDTQISY